MAASGQGRRMRVLAVGSLKGGAGKTTTALNVACAAAESGWRVLHVDLDSQSPSILALGADPVHGRTLAQALLPDSGVSARDAIVAGPVPTLDVLAAPHDDLDDAAVKLERLGARAYTAVARVIGQVEEEYDLAICDTPPELGGLEEYALFSADVALAACRPNSLDWPPTRSFVQQVRDLGATHLAPRLRLLGLALVAYDAAAEETTFIESRLAAADVPVLDTKIPVSRLASKAVVAWRPAVIEYPGSSFARAYRRLTAEVLGHLVNGTTPPVPDTDPAPIAVGQG